MKHAVILLVIALLAFAPNPCAQAQAPAASAFPNLQNDPLFDQRTYEKLRETPVDISWNNVDLTTALRDLSLQAMRADPEREQFIFRFTTEATPEQRQRKVSLLRRQGSVFGVLESLGQQASFTVRVHKNIVLIEPGPGTYSTP